MKLSVLIFITLAIGVLAKNYPDENSLFFIDREVATANTLQFMGRQDATLCSPIKPMFVNPDIDKCINSTLSYKNAMVVVYWSILENPYGEICDDARRCQIYPTNFTLTVGLNSDIRDYDCIPGKLVTATNPFSIPPNGCDETWYHDRPVWNNCSYFWNYDYCSNLVYPPSCPYFCKGEYVMIYPKYSSVPGASIFPALVRFDYYTMCL